MFKHLIIFILLIMPLVNFGQTLSGTNAQREHWVLIARENPQQLSLAVQELRRLYAQTQDTKVREDLIALLLQQHKPSEALAVCLSCQLSPYSTGELENLARAARDTRQFPQSLAFYRQLQLDAPDNKNAWMGEMLLAVDARDYELARKAAANYQQKFGLDTQLREGESYFAQTLVSNSERLFKAQEALSKAPNDPIAIKRVYQAAAQLGSYPAQEEIISAYPSVFSQVDLLWLKHSKAIFLSRAGSSTDNQALSVEALKLLNEVVAQAPKDNPIYNKARLDRVEILLKLRLYQEALNNADALLAEGLTLPPYIEEARADALLKLKRPFAALKIYQSLVTRTTNKEVLVQKMVAANADAARYADAEKLLLSNPQPIKVKDFTGKALLRNPDYPDYIYSKIRIAAWRGYDKEAKNLMNLWLASAPNDADGWILRGDIALWEGKPDDALSYYEKAKNLTAPKNMDSVLVHVANAQLDRGNLTEAEQIINTLNVTNEDYKNLQNRVRAIRAPQFSIDSGIKQTTPNHLNGNEINEEATLYSAQNQQGLRGFVSHYYQRSPYDQESIASGGVGLGLQLQRFPYEMRLEAGHGTHENRHAYAWLGLKYRINQQWQLSSNFKINSDETPLRALKDHVYGNQASIAAQYTANDRFSAGAGLSLLHLSDHNLRRSTGMWLSYDLFQHDRWELNSLLSASATHNRTISTASYFNPSHDFSVSEQLDLSYRQPFDGGITLKHSLVSSVGRYWQSNQNPQNTWSIGYNHEWAFDSKWGLGYGFGRRKSIYDGVAEFQNFAQLHINMRFE